MTAECGMSRSIGVQTGQIALEPVL